MLKKLKLAFLIPLLAAATGCAHLYLVEKDSCEDAGEHYYVCKNVMKYK